MNTITKMKESNSKISSSIIGSVLFAIALWSYASLNEQYITKLNVPIKVVLPENRAIENPLPPEVTVEVKGSGWHLFNLIYFNTSKECLVDLSKTDINSKSYNISHSLMIKSLENLLNVEARTITPESIDLRTGSVGEYSVTVKPSVSIYPKDGFTVVGNIEVIPSKVRITGNDKIVKDIHTWYTKAAVFADMNKPFRAEVPLSDTMRGVVKLSAPNVEILANIQQTAEIIIPDVKIEIVGGNLAENHKIFPTHIDVTLRGGINQIEDISPDMISAYVDISKLSTNKNAMLKAEINAPKFVQVLTQNTYLWYLIESNSLQGKEK